MKIAYIAGHEFLYKQDNGGRQCSYRNYLMIKKIFGEENVHLYLFSNTPNINAEKNINIQESQKKK